MKLNTFFATMMLSTLVSGQVKASCDVLVKDQLRRKNLIQIENVPIRSDIMVDENDKVITSKISSIPNVKRISGIIKTSSDGFLAIHYFVDPKMVETPPEKYDNSVLNNIWCSTFGKKDEKSFKEGSIYISFNSNLQRDLFREVLKRSPSFKIKFDHQNISGFEQVSFKNISLQIGKDILKKEELEKEMSYYLGAVKPELVDDLNHSINQGSIRPRFMKVLSREQILKIAFLADKGIYLKEFLKVIKEHRLMDAYNENILYNNDEKDTVLMAYQYLMNIREKSLDKKN
jgi:hypothetical protein